MAATKKQTEEWVKARVYCPICSHMVQATARRAEIGRYEAIHVVKGQKCARCSAVLDAASILDVLEVLPSQDAAKEAQNPAEASRAKRRKRIAA
jgi:Na+-translocating ferredoxin:NAD+ oxidoreductase RNF subunit RnfB